MVPTDETFARKSLINYGSAQAHFEGAAEAVALQVVLNLDHTFPSMFRREYSLCGV